MSEPAKFPLSSAPQPLNWGHATDEIHAGGLDVKRSANDVERAAVAAVLGVVSCETLALNYRLTRAPAEGFRLKGRLAADVVQSCVVTLAPVLETIATDLSVEFRPAGEQRDVGGVVDLEDDTEIELLEGKWLDVGRIVFEELAAALNPYPRRPGAEFSPVLAPVEGALKDSPFATLAKLKPSGKSE